jgi:hypothetical protein
VVDRVYKAHIPALRKALEELNRGFSNLNLDTKWNKLRVEPLLIHVRRLEELLKSDHSARLTRAFECTTQIWSIFEIMFQR